MKNLIFMLLFLSYFLFANQEILKNQAPKYKAEGFEKWPEDFKNKQSEDFKEYKAEGFEKWPMQA